MAEPSLSELAEGIRQLPEMLALKNGGVRVSESGFLTVSYALGGEDSGEAIDAAKAAMSKYVRETAPSLFDRVRMTTAGPVRNESLGRGEEDEEEEEEELE